MGHDAENGDLCCGFLILSDYVTMTFLFELASQFLFEFECLESRFMPVDRDAGQKVFVAVLIEAQMIHPRVSIYFG